MEPDEANQCAMFRGRVTNEAGLNMLNMYASEFVRFNDRLQLCLIFNTNYE